MHTFSSVLANLEAVPLSAAWLLEEIAEKRGHQDLFTRQSPEQLKRLREHAMIESAVASNRIEGVEVDRDRVGTILFGNGIMRDRDEEEVRGYRKALDLIHKAVAALPHRRARRAGPTKRSGESAASPNCRRQDGGSPCGRDGAGPVRAKSRLFSVSPWVIIIRALPLKG